MKLTILAVSVSLALFACSKKDDAGKAGKAGKASGSKTAKAKPLKAAKLTSMAVMIDVTDGAKVNDTTKGAGFPSATIFSTPTIFVSAKNDMYWKKDLAAQKATIQKSVGNTFKKFTKEESKGDTFHLEYEMKSMTGSALYSFHIRSKINGKLYDCHTNTSSTAAQANGIKMCKTLRAAK